MALLTIQLDLRLRRFGPDGLDDCVASFLHIDLPPEAAGGDWSEGTRLAQELLILSRAQEFLRSQLPEFLAHCDWEQPELPFG